MTRNGKIARLPRLIRDALNRRIDDGEPGKILLAWLNAQDEVRNILSRDFEGRPVTKQNLFEWKNGGYRDWQRQQEACDRVHRLLDLSIDLDAAAEEQSIPDLLAGVLATELAAETQRLLETTTDPKERWTLLCEALRQLKDLRAGDRAAIRSLIEKERWEMERDRLEEEEAKARARAPLWEAFKRRQLAKSHPVAPNPANSNQIQQI